MQTTDRQRLVVHIAQASDQVNLTALTALDETPDLDDAGKLVRGLITEHLYDKHPQVKAAYDAWSEALDDERIGSRVIADVLNECRNCGGTGRVKDTVCAAITHRSRTVQRRCRYCKGTGQLAPIALPVQDEIGEIPAWMLGEDEDEQATEQVEARELRDGDVIVRMASDDESIISLITTRDSQVFAWLGSDEDDTHTCATYQADERVLIKRRG